MLLQKMTFDGLDVAYDARVLRPRPWTGLQSRWAARQLRHSPDGPVLELCAGVGQIGLLTIQREPRPLVMVDESQVACEYARMNADAAGLGALVEVRRGCVTTAVAPWESFALILADPPWVRHSDLICFPDDPVSAIDGGDDGLRVAWQCLLTIDRHLMDGGSALLQLGSEEQVVQVERHLREHTSRLGIVEHRVVSGHGALVHLRVTGPLMPQS